MRRTWLRGCENVHKRYLVHVAGHNLGILMRLLIGAGTLREAAACALAYLFLSEPRRPWRSSFSPRPTTGSSSWS
jgi:transposase